MPTAGRPVEELAVLCEPRLLFEDTEPVCREPCELYEALSSLSPE